MTSELRTDSELLASSVANPEAFLGLFERHFDRIAEYVARRAGGGAGDELASEVFVRAFADRRRYDPNRADVLPWLYGIATNVLREHFRESRRELALAEKLSTEVAAGAAVASSRSDDDLASRVGVAMRELSAKDREPLLLYALGDLDYQEIADALTVPIGTVRSRINRARAQLRQLLDDSAKTTRAAAVTAPRLLAREGTSNG